MAGGQCFFIGVGAGDSAVSSQFRALAEELADRGNRVVLLLYGRERKPAESSGNLSIYYAPSRRPTRLRDALFLARLIRRYRPGCLIGNFAWVNWFLITGWLMGIRARVAWYHTLDSQIRLDSTLPGWKLAYLRARKRFVYRLATTLVAVSDAAQEDLKVAYGVAPRRVVVWRNSLKDPGVPPVEPAPGRLICVGRFDPCKGQDVLVRAAALLAHEGVRFAVQFLGDGRLKPKCQALVRDLGLADRCEFVGAVPHSEVLRRIASAQAVVVPSRSDNCPLVAIESLALGRPVVASAVGGIPEIVRDGVDGFLVPPNDPEALAAGLKVLLNDLELSTRMGDNARQRFLSCFEQSLAIRKQADWLERAVRAAPPRG